MKILYFIGNGFDLNLDLKTEYSEFYKYYTKIESKSDLINTLKKKIAEDLKYWSPKLKNWSDLEIALGKYTEHLKTEDEFNEIYNDLEDRLAEYLQKQEASYDFSKLNYKKFISDLVLPESNLKPTDLSTIKSLRVKSERLKTINIVTFNYTKSIEKIILNDIQKTNAEINNIDKNANLRSIMHIHGDTDNDMVMGVNDVSQIKNESFRSNPNITDTLIKKNCYKALRNNLEENCKLLILNSDLICIFGSSLGETDKSWWELIGNHITKKQLIIFVKSGKTNKRRGHADAGIGREIINIFLSKTKLTKVEMQSAKGNIIVAVNTNMFNLKSKEN